ncbi:activating signal cointegrator 1 complex subunit 2 isoform X2 [Puntigrus tetrazona]|uniref:activating signal cointegrator 1 complex subunit 2 isoform X2 n=1 Tax=Puntigrus tetrazona TaxID=1606681 RepID=UPI001C8A1015|nr:activating signal cointegrator 1 complex subunit 2 isoform X2 [Puntigrus tetrazona]XP_043096621.1 activating signal cointegrator 1 complex subunit 2 isoform X2 [Puntigrus tetrazona]
MACAKVPLDELHVTEPFGPQAKERTLPALVVFDESLQRCLDSYLRHAPRGLDPSGLSSSPAVAEMQRNIHRSVFMVFLRMATHKESKENFITPAVFAEIIYNNYLFDIPKILDLCVLFGKGNSQLLHKMIENIFTQQPSYYGDLNETIPSIGQVFDMILQKCGIQSEDTGTGQPLKLNANKCQTAMTMPEEELADLVLYMCDTCTTIHSFLDIFPEACSTFKQHNFLNRLSSFYEMAVPDLEKAVKKRNFNKSLQEDMWRRISHSRKKMVEIAHLLLQHTCLQPILEGAENMASCVDDLLQNFTAFLQEKRFLADYDEQFSIADDISLLQQAFPHLDDTRTSYLLQGVESAWECVGKKRSFPSSSNHRGGAEGKTGRDLAASQTDGAGVSGDGEELRGAEAMTDVPQKGDNGAVCTVSSGEVESLLSHIRDLLPDLGEGFILACLEEYGYKSELVINNILEDKLSPSLDKLDRAMARPARKELPSVLSTRSNVFDDDEFDVFNRDRLDMSRIWKGRRQGESVRATLDDKQHIEEQRARYQAYQTVVDEIPIENDPSRDLDNAFGTYDYDDEYDDTYDINQIGANDLDEEDELLNRRPFTTPQVLRAAKQAQENDEDEEEDEDKNEAVKKDHFVQDPAVLRERAEARRAAMQSRKGYRPPPASHVVGGPKGRGQTQETVLDRRRKEASKGRGANHSRRMMADRKRNKGMIPS